MVVLRLSVVTTASHLVLATDGPDVRGQCVERTMLRRRCGDSNGEDSASMVPKLTRASVCVLRLEVHAGGPVITVRTTPDVERLAGERVQRVTSVEAAVEAVRDFLDNAVSYSGETGSADESCELD